MSISSIRSDREKLGALEQVALAMVEDILHLLEDDRYMDMIEELVDMRDLDLDSEEADKIFCKRVDNAEGKMMLRVARALMNMYTSRPDKIVRLALHGDSDR